MNWLTFSSIFLSIFCLWSCKANNYPDENAQQSELEIVECKQDCSICQAHPDNLKHVRFRREEYHQISGTIRSAIQLTADEKWLLRGPVTVEAGARLTIAAGTVIHARHGDGEKTTYLSIQRDGFIEAKGTAENPIIFTSARKRPEHGDWGGIILNGNATVQFPEKAFGEGGTGPYGGEDNMDSSGILSYVRVEYAGENLTEDIRMNGFSFYGCGAGTQLDHLQAYYCKDDGFEFIGGSTRLKYALATACGDDGFDFSEGWQGKGQFWIVEQTNTDGDRGIEGDNHKKMNSQLPFSNPQISNITLVGTDDGDGKNQGIKLKEGTKGVFINGVILGFPKYGVYIEHDQTLTNLSDGNLKVKAFIIHADRPVKYKNDDGEIPEMTNGLAFSENNNTLQEDDNQPDFLEGYKGVSTQNAIDPTTLDTWFTPANYRGALEATNDWTLGWARAAVQS